MTTDPDGTRQKGVSTKIKKQCSYFLSESKYHIQFPVTLKRDLVSILNIKEPEWTL